MNFAALTETLANPEWTFPMAVCAVGVATALSFSRRAARRRRAALLGPGARPPRSHLASDGLLCLALLAVGIGLLGPPLAEQELRVRASGVDLVVLLDVSRSMDARDVGASRLDRAKAIAREVLGRLSPQDRAALAVFGGVGSLLTPLTPDVHALTDLLHGIDTRLIEPASTDIAAGVRGALGGYETASLRPRSLLILSDGEITAGGGVAAADVARAEVRVVAVALGSEVGATIPVHSSVLHDATGTVVISRRRDATLAVLATRSDGALRVVDDDGEIDVAGVVASLRREAGTTPGEWMLRRVRSTAALPLAAIAFAVLLVEGGRRPRLPSMSGRAARTVVATSLLFSVGAQHSDRGSIAADLAAIEAAVRRDPHDAASLLALGAARLEHDQPDAAARAFRAASVSANNTRTAALAEYDLGVAELSRDRLAAARDAFFDSLALEPRGPVAERARFNLQWTVAELANSGADDDDRSPPAPARAPGDDAPPKPVADVDLDAGGDERDAESADELPQPMSTVERDRWLEKIRGDPQLAARASLPTPQRGRGARAVW